MSEKEKTKGLVASKKREISTIDGKRKEAEKSKQEGEKVALEAEKKDAERQRPSWSGGWTCTRLRSTARRRCRRWPHP